MQLFLPRPERQLVEYTMQEGHTSWAQLEQVKDPKRYNAVPNDERSSDEQCKKWETRNLANGGISYTVNQ
jgi:hypothetical protein